MHNIDLKRTNRLVRTEFYMVGKYDMPMIYQQTPDLTNIQFIGYHNTKINDIWNRYKTVHFFTEDHKFTAVYSFPEQSLPKLKQYKQILSPDFSVYTDMPLSLQINNTFKRRWCSALWQREGLTVIPSITWGDKRSFEFCFDGIEEKSIVAVSTTSARQHRAAFLAGFSAQGDPKIRATRRPIFSYIKKNGLIVDGKVYKLSDHAFKCLLI